MTGPIRVLLADDHALVRQTLAERLAREPDIEVVELLATADQVVTESTRPKPDVVVLNIDMPGASCFEAARRVRVSSPDASVTTRPAPRAFSLLLGCHGRLVRPCFGPHWQQAASGTRRRKSETALAL